MYLPILRVHFKEKSEKYLSDDTYAMLFFLLVFFIKAYVMSSHLNCIEKSTQFKWIPKTCKSICCGYSFELHQQVDAFKWVPITCAFIKK